MNLHMQPRHLALFLATAFSLAGCGSVALTRTGAPQAARPANCTFQVLTAAPAGNFVEVGTLDVTGVDSSDNLASFKTNIAPRVCEAGGDAVIAMANGYGYYIKATVLKAEPGGTSAPNLTQGSVPAPSAGGCTFDTQCKGDRVCTKGECVEGRGARRP